MELTLAQISLRLLIAAFFGSIIGLEREIKSHPAGLRTHILVCVGAAIVAMIQKEIMLESLQTTIADPQLAGIIRSDPARLICQVVSGIGFIGAGTIVVTKNAVYGLTTAASLWVTAVVGLSTGMGYYWISVMGFVFIFFSLTILKKIVSSSANFLPSITRIEIEYCSLEAKEFIQKYFAEHKIKVKSSDFSMVCHDGSHIYTGSYTLELCKGLSYSDIACALSEHKDITKIHLENLGGSVELI